jgi:hypothetical protein
MKRSDLCIKNYWSGFALLANILERIPFFYRAAWLFGAIFAEFLYVCARYEGKIKPNNTPQQPIFWFSTDWLVRHG